MATVAACVRYRDRGVVGVGLGGRKEIGRLRELAPAFATARDEGLAVVPHAGEMAGAESVREAMDVLRPVRIRHGVRAVEDPALVAELVEGEVVLDVCPTSNVRTGAVASLEEHPLPVLIAAGVRCTVSTDDRAMFGNDLSREYAAVAAMGVDLASVYEAGVFGAQCDAALKATLQALAR